MNHHNFRQFIQKLPDYIIKSFNINPAHFKAVCFVLSMYGDYETGTNIRPSWLTVAKEAGVNRKTAMKVRDVLLSQGILIVKRKNEANISVYDFQYPDEMSIFGEELSNIIEQMSSIDGHNITNNTTNNNKRIIKKFKNQKEESVVQKVTVETKPSLEDDYYTWFGESKEEYNKTPVVHFEEEEDGYDEKFDYPDSVIQNGGVDVSNIGDKIQEMLNGPFTFGKI